jgi:hypothetical protein
MHKVRHEMAPSSLSNMFQKKQKKRGPWTPNETSQTWFPTTEA